MKITGAQHDSSLVTDTLKSNEDIVVPEIKRLQEELFDTMQNHLAQSSNNSEGIQKGSSDQSDLDGGMFL